MPFSIRYFKFNLFDIKNWSYILMIVALPFYSNSQQYNWSATFGGNGTLTSNSISFDVNGNLLTTGSYSSNVDFNPGAGVNTISSQGLNDGFVHRMNAQNGLYGNSLTYGGTLNDNCIEAAVDQAGNIYTIGHFAGTVDFDPLVGVSNMTATGNGNGFIVKTDVNSVLQWHYKFEAPVYATVSALAIDQSNNVYVAGYFHDSIDLDFGPAQNVFYSAGYDDIYVVKLDPDGNLIWARTYGSSNSERILSMKIDQNNEVVIGGVIYADIDMNPTGTPIVLTNSGGSDLFIAKISSSGSTVWAKKCGSTSYEGVKSLVIGENNSIYSTGYYASSTVDFNPGAGVYNLSNSGGNDGFVLKLDEAGNFVHAIKLSSSSSEQGNTIEYRNNGIYVGGIFSGALDFDPVGTQIRSSNGSYDGYLLKLSTALQYEWVYTIGSASGNEYINDIALDALGGIFITGNHEGSFDCNIGSPWIVLSNSGGANAFIIKLFECSNSTNAINVNSCAPYISPSGMQIQNSGTYSDVIQNASGCDSLLTLNVTISPASYSSVNISTCPPFISPSGNIHLNSGTYLDTIAASNGCDSIITSNFNSLSTSNTIDIESCQNYISPSGTYLWTTSGTYSDTILNLAGCDSVLTINLVIHSSSTSMQFAASCNSYTWLENGQTYFNTGIYNTVLNNVFGCDSTITLNLIINQANSGEETITSCTNFLWSANGVNYTSSGTYTANLLNSSGCDSTATLNLTIQNLNLNVQQVDNELSVLQNNANYQWLSCPSMAIIAGETSQTFTASQNGQYAVVISQNNCVDTSQCFIVNTMEIQNLNAQNLVRIYPNPNHGTFIIETDLAFGKGELFNAQGQIIQNFHISNKSTIISLPLEAGVYYLRVALATGVSTNIITID